jgi:hypothetical protein
MKMVTFSIYEIATETNLADIYLNEGVQHGFIKTLKLLLKRYKMKNNDVFCKVDSGGIHTQIDSSVLIKWFDLFDQWNKSKKMRNKQIFSYVHLKHEWFLNKTKRANKFQLTLDFFTHLPEFYCLYQKDMEKSAKEIALKNLGFTAESIEYLDCNKLIIELEKIYDQYKGHTFIRYKGI